ncbi:MAG: response regulator [Planctomycetes bacterium]|nr:response regulator [Planctomycetota bacterium]
MLAVDDDQVVREGLLRLGRSENHGFVYETADSLGDAMRRIDQVQPAVVLTDYVLEDGYGTDLVALTRAPVVLMTGFGSESVAAEALRMGAYDYLIKDTEGRFLGLVESILERVLLRRTSEQTERQREDRLLEAQRDNRTLEQFASLIANSLSIPLQTITHYCGLLMAHQALRTDRLATAYAQSANEGARRANQLITEVLEYARITAFGNRFGPVDADSTMTDALADLRGTVLPQNSEVSVGPLPWVVGDRVQLRALFRRLMGRAIARCTKVDRPVYVSASARVHGGLVEFRVEDGGPGYAGDPAAGADFWEDLAPGGRSLDIAIGRRVVERHGGQLWIGGGGVPSDRAFVAFTLQASSLENPAEGSS